LTKIFQKHILVTVSGRSGASMGRHNYIAGGSVPYLVTTSTPIYKVPTGRLKINPYHWKPGKVIIARGWPFNGKDARDKSYTPAQESQEQEQDTIDIVKEVDAREAYKEWYDSR